MNETLLCRFYARGAGASVVVRGGERNCISAEGGETANAIGYGKVVLPAYDNFRQPTAQQVRQGDLCIVWSTAPYLETMRPLLVACFIVRSRRQTDKGDYEISGPDLLGELEEFKAISQIGELAEVVVSAMSLGGRVINHPPPQDDDWEVLEAAYPPRAYTLQDVTAADRYRMLFSDITTIQETDTLRVEFADGEVFTTTVTAVGDERQGIEFADPLPQQVTTSMKVQVWSTRLRVSDASALIEGERVYYTPGTAGEESNPRPTGSVTIDRVEIGDGDAPDYIYTTDPITDQIDDGAPLTQHQYTAPTAGDLDLLLNYSTQNQWLPLRSELATTGTAYAPNRESVWDVLMAMAEMSGYQFRKYFRGLTDAEVLGSPSVVLASLRRLEYFPPGYPVVAGEVQTISLDKTMSTAHATILSKPQTEDVAAAVTHLFPYGGGAGSGALDFRLADKGTVIAEFGAEKIGWGVLNNNYFIYNKTLVNAGQRRVDRDETFAHISPINDTFDARKEAANQLLRAACEWLLAHDEAEVTYQVDVFTIGEPRVGDVVSLNYAGGDPYSVNDTNLIITEVHHRVEPSGAYGGWRVTTLAMNKSAIPFNSGAKLLARELLELKRGFRQANIGARGDARISYDKMEFGQDATVDSKSGNLLVRSLLGDVTIRAETGDVYLDGNTIDISGQVRATGVIRSEVGLALPDDRLPNDWVYQVVNLRGIPRLAGDYRERPDA